MRSAPQLGRFPNNKDAAYTLHCNCGHSLLGYGLKSLYAFHLLYIDLNDGSNLRTAKFDCGHTIDFLCRAFSSQILKKINSHNIITQSQLLELKIYS